MQAATNFKAFGAKGFATGAARKLLGVQDVAEYVVHNNLENKWGFYVEDGGKPIKIATAKADAAFEAFAAAAVITTVAQAKMPEMIAKVSEALGQDVEKMPVDSMSPIVPPVLGKPSQGVVNPFQRAAALKDKPARDDVQNLQAAIEAGEQDAAEEVSGPNPFANLISTVLKDRPASASPAVGGANPNRVGKLEKDRPEQNGIKRPSAGGLCRMVWDWSQAFLDEKGVMPTAKDIRAHGDTEGWSPVTTMIQFYRWRKFIGVSGRAKGE